MNQRKRTNDMRLPLLALPVVLSMLLGTALMGVVGTFSPPIVQFGALGMLMGTTIGLLLALSTRYQQDVERQQRVLSLLRVPTALVDEPDLFHVQQDFSLSLVRLAKQSDAILRECVVVKLFGMLEQLREFSHGCLTFTATEAWRDVYERVLRTGGIDRYQSVAWVRTEDYWRDVPGEQSLRMNLELSRQGISVERILVICDFLWPPGAQAPSKEIREWIEPQYEQGIDIRLVRESDLFDQQDFLLDFGIYGDRATGTLYLDDQARTQRFELHFDKQSIELARDRWKRLKVYTVSYGTLLDLQRVCH